ncbi:hypothetical protein ARMGADRAFT_1067755 [Armillaria gallica]|uniref:Uncharacterized protein n=1 Tax=Armillaria gallica TaxID=47427 RepID=A0A2H3D7J0_ARMGA|nr:hypothetical protein ARMGADRAFT_1067755 [Armillaria gallica]
MLAILPIYPRFRVRGNVKIIALQNFKARLLWGFSTGTAHRPALAFKFCLVQAQIFRDEAPLRATSRIHWDPDVNPAGSDRVFKCPTPARPNVCGAAMYGILASKVDEQSSNGGNALKDGQRRGGSREERSTLIARPFLLHAPLNRCRRQCLFLRRRDTFSLDAGYCCIQAQASSFKSGSVMDDEVRQDENELRRARARWAKKSAHLWMDAFSVVSPGPLSITSCGCRCVLLILGLCFWLGTIRQARVARWKISMPVRGMRRAFRSWGQAYLRGGGAMVETDSDRRLFQAQSRLKEGSYGSTENGGNPNSSKSTSGACSDL